MNTVPVSAETRSEENLLEDVVAQIKAMGFDDGKVRAAVTALMFNPFVPTSTFELLFNAALDKVMSESETPQSGLATPVAPKA